MQLRSDVLRPWSALHRNFGVAASGGGADARLALCTHALEALSTVEGNLFVAHTENEERCGKGPVMCGMKQLYGRVREVELMVCGALLLLLCLALCHAGGTSATTAVASGWRCSEQSNALFEVN